MRPIRFRAWDKSEGKWVDFGEVMIRVDGFLACAKQGHWMVDTNVIEFSQYTGLHDKNGKEIYEGDILNYWHGLNDCDGRVEVDMECGITLIERYKDGDTDYWDLEPNMEFEVIGNIYENPELLGK